MQLAALEAEAKRNGRKLTVYREDAASAKSLKNRPVLASALADLKAGTYEALAVSKLDRLSRSVADFAALLETSDRQRWALICLDLEIDTSTITGAAMAQVTCTFAEMERKKIAERTRDGVAKMKATTGKHMGRRSALPAPTVQRIVSERDVRSSRHWRFSVFVCPIRRGTAWMHHVNCRALIATQRLPNENDGIQRNRADPSKVQGHRESAEARG
ncbi:recombinase family protein [Arthrobacter sp. AZCC_0090]|uniref:recombinase family protein n=1 Tax=Arthrobacter sp. AZCC_0090 TaxID=2735881 RepID=UPI0017D0BDC5|nr:recombinase family protein [Arthrobacter sp. AZCC_0090]MBB6405910.1 DNA invertase Pin-like site-specific DNA recombinase [Arthrobacter sp. AZCC_0090]